MPHSFPIFDDLLIILIVAVPIVFLCYRLKLPSLVGFMVTGVIIGPYGLKLIKELETIEVLAEIGVILLLFTIGLEFSLKRIIEMKRLVFIGGGLQVGLTILVTFIAIWLFGKPANQAVYYGFLFALSSTAIVLKSYVERGEVDAPHGRAGVGILLFQDLSIIPMMILIPLLGGQKETSPLSIFTTIGTAVLAILGIIVASKIIVPFILKHIVAMRSPEVFIITVVFICLATSWTAAHFGISLALGAFIAGMVLSESDYSHQIVADILPFRDIFNSIFFISIGMLLSITALSENFSIVLFYVALLIIGKAIVIVISILTLGYSLRISVMAGLGLAQVGEFSFVMAKVGISESLMTTGEYQKFLAASIISMVATPFLIAIAPKAGIFIQSLFRGKKPDGTNLNVLEEDEHQENEKKHVIIVGYGLNGKNLARVLKAAGLPYIVLETNAQTVTSAKASGERIYFGDATRREVLHHVAVEKASIMVVAISDPAATRRTVHKARQLNPDLHIIVRTRYVVEMQELVGLGANEVIPEEFETSIEIFSRVLEKKGVSRILVQKQIDVIREEGYEMLRSPSTNINSSSIEMMELSKALGEVSSETVLIEADSPVIGTTLAELNIRQKTNATISAIIRDSATEVAPGGDFKIELGDILVVIGKEEDVKKAVGLLSGKES